MIRSFVKFILFLLYRYYNDSKWGNIAYFSSILVFLALLYINALTLIAFANINLLNLLPWWDTSDPKGLKYLKFLFLFILPGYFLVKFFIKENEIKNLNYPENKIHRGNTILITYGVVSFIIFITAII